HRLDVARAGAQRHDQGCRRGRRRVTAGTAATIEHALDEAALAKLFRRFARTECPPGELYDRLCRSAADEPALLQLLAVAAPEQRRPNLLLAAVHDLVLAGDAHPLSGYFQSVGGQRAADEALH